MMMMISEQEPIIYECGERTGECTCYDCAKPDCDNFTNRLSDKYCAEHQEEEETQQ